LKRGDRIIRGRIKRKSDSAIFDRNITFFSMISHSKYKQDTVLFDPIYEYLSSYAHSGMRHIFKDFDQETYGYSVGGDWNEDGSAVSFHFMASMIISMILHHLHGESGISLMSKRDIEYYCRVAKTMVKNSIVSSDSRILDNERQAFQSLFDRMKILPNRKTFRKI
jgi:hypothetical protein